MRPRRDSHRERRARPAVRTARRPPGIPSPATEPEPGPIHLCDQYPAPSCRNVELADMGRMPSSLSASQAPADQARPSVTAAPRPGALGVRDSDVVASGTRPSPAGWASPTCDVSSAPSCSRPGDLDAARHHFGVAFSAYLRSRRPMGAAMVARRMGHLDLLSEPGDPGLLGRSERRLVRSIRLGRGEPTNHAVALIRFGCP